MDAAENTPETKTRGFYCARCGYNLMGIAMGDPCPECGSDFMLDNPYSQRCGRAIAAMILGIMSMMTCMFYGIPGLVCGILALVFARQARDRVQLGQAPQFSLDFARAGRVCGWVGIGLSIVFLVIMAAYMIFIFAIIGAAAGAGGFAPVPPPPMPLPTGP